MLKKKIEDYLYKLSIEGASERIKPPCNVYISETLDYITIDKSTGYPYCIPVRKRMPHKDLCDYVIEQLDKLTKPSKYSYRGVKFSRTNAGFWLFDVLLPTASFRWAHWSRFLTNEEADTLRACTIEEGGAIMRRAIDRAHSDAPVYTGDIRYRDWEKKCA